MRRISALSAAEEGFMGWLRRRQGGAQSVGMSTTPAAGPTRPPGWMPAGCNCQGTNTGKKCSGAGAAGWVTPAPTTTMQAPAQPPIPPPPMPPPLPGPPPPLPPVAAKPLPGLPGLPGISVDLLPTLGPPPLARMTPFPTMAPVPTTPAPPTTAGPTTSWQMTPLGLVPGTTLSPFMAYMMSQSTAPPSFMRFGPAPGPAPAPAPGPAPGVYLQEKVGSWNPLSFLQRQVMGCDCPCADFSSPAGVDQVFAGVLTQNMYR